MHSLVRRFLKTAIVFLGVGLVIGLWVMAQREWYGRFPPSYLASAHTHARPQRRTASVTCRLPITRWTGMVSRR